MISFQTLERLWPELPTPDAGTFIGLAGQVRLVVIVPKMNNHVHATCKAHLCALLVFLLRSRWCTVGAEGLYDVDLHLPIDLA